MGTVMTTTEYFVPQEAGANKARTACARFGAALLLLGLSACGGDDSATDTRSAGTAVVVPATVESSPAAAPANRRIARAHQKQGVTALAVSPGGGSWGVASADGRIRVVDGGSDHRWQGASKPDARTGRAAPVVGLVYGADGKNLISVSRDSQVKVWDARTGAHRVTLHGHEHPLRAVAASANGSLVATGGEETRVMLWDGATGKLKRILSGHHTDFVNALDLTADGRLLASADASGRILVWDTINGQLLHALRGHATEVTSVAWRPDGRTLYSADEDGRVFAWDAVTGLQTHAFAQRGAPIRTLAVSADGSVLAAGASNGRIVVWDLGSSTIWRDFAASASSVNTVVFEGRGSHRLVVGSGDDAVAAWDLDSLTAR